MGTSTSNRSVRSFLPSRSKKAISQVAFTSDCSLASSAVVTVIVSCGLPLEASCDQCGLGASVALSITATPMICARTAAIIPLLVIDISPLIWTDLASLILYRPEMHGELVHLLAGVVSCSPDFDWLRSQLCACRCRSFQNETQFNVAFFDN